MVKLPAKFDDISKSAAGVLNDDYQCDKFQLKAKQGTNFGGASSDLLVDIAQGKDIVTPTKLTFKFPKPLVFLDGFSIDKVELDAKGGKKIEASFSEKVHKIDGLKFEVKTDLDKSLGYTATYTGVKDTAIKAETSHYAPTDVSVEAVHGFGQAIFGAQLKGTSSLCPSVGVNYTHGPFFASVFAKNQFSEFTVHALHNTTADLKIAATYQHGGKNNGKWGVGCSASVTKDLSVKAKFENANSLSVTAKKELASKTNLFVGANYNTGSGSIGYGAKLSIE